MKIILALGLAAFSAAQMSAPPPGVASLAESFNEAYDPKAKARLLRQLAAAQPVTPRDVQSLYEIFTRYADRGVRDSVLACLDRVDPRNMDLEPIFLGLLQQPDPEAKLLGIRGALTLRSPAALPLVEKLAKKRFAMTDPEQTVFVSKRNAWWNQYEALDALAQWKPKEAEPLLLKRSRQAPRLAAILARRFWKDALPLSRKWLAGDATDQQRAQEALRADVPSEQLRAARPEMLAIVLDPTAPGELRHQVALKLGLVSTEAEVSSLLKDYRSASDARTKVYLTAALFASRSAQVVPLLLDYAKTDPSPLRRAGARVELKELMAPADYRAVVEWAAKNDPDPANREQAQRELTQPR